MNETLLAIVFIALGMSFLYKFGLAAVFGKTAVWEGFLPITIISPFFIHLPAGKNSLIKNVHNAWVQMVLAPIFFLVALVLLASGADRLGMPGTEAINYVLTLGNTDAPAAITYDRTNGYKFPIWDRTTKALYKALTQPVLSEGQEGQDGSQQGQEQQQGQEPAKPQ